LFTSVGEVEDAIKSVLHFRKIDTFAIIKKAPQQKLSENIREEQIAARKG
jgi:hypothetical protein